MEVRGWILRIRRALDWRDCRDGFSTGFALEASPRRYFLERLFHLAEFHVALGRDRIDFEGVGTPDLLTEHGRRDPRAGKGGDNQSVTGDEYDFRGTVDS